MKITKIIFAFLLLAVSNLLVSAQTSASEAALRQYFEGKNIAVKIDMPATNLGVEVRSAGVDRGKNQKRLFVYGVAISNGVTARITGVRLNGTELSFELDGGGAADLDLDKMIGAKPGNISPSVYESRTRARVGADQPAGDANALRSSLVYESHKRQQDDAVYRAAYETRRKAAIENDRTQRATMGSRFVIKLKRTTAVTPETVIGILADHLDFSVMK